MYEMSNLTSFHPKKVKRLRKIGKNVIFYYIQKYVVYYEHPQNEHPPNFEAIL